MHALTPDGTRYDQAGADVVSAHVGTMSGGTCGFEDTYDMDEACKRTQDV